MSYLMLILFVLIVCAVIIYFDFRLVKKTIRRLQRRHDSCIDAWNDHRALPFKRTTMVSGEKSRQVAESR